MKHSEDNKPRLGHRDTEILQHVARYRLTTNEVLHRVMFSGATANAVVKVTNRLCQSQLLQRFPLVHPQLYFVLGRTAARDFGVPEHRAQPLGPQALPCEYAVLTFAMVSGEPRLRLTARELMERHPWMPSTLQNMPHCLEGRPPDDVLLSIRVDLGGPPDHIARKCDSDLQARIGTPNFFELLSAKRFRAVVLTGTTEKSAAIERALSQHLWPQNYTFHIAVIPELIQLIPGGFHG